MERFTQKDSTYYEKALARLQELENKLENGCLIELPCVANCGRGWYVTIYISQDGEICASNPHRYTLPQIPRITP